MSEKRPNIVFIHAESMDGRKMGCMDHPAMQDATPHLDSLAENGTMFRNAYSTCPVCNPSRASMWSGKYPHHYDCWNNHEGLHDDVPTFRDALQRAGYRTAALGPLDYQWGKHSIRDRVGSWTRSACIERPICRSPLPEVVDGAQRPHANDWGIATEGIDFLEESRKDEDPFMLYLTTGLVHPAFKVHQRYMSRISEEQIQVPPTLGAMEAHDHPVDRYTRITKNCTNHFPTKLVHQMRHIYFAMIAELDEIVGRILGALDEMGLSDSTYIIFSSDHGEMAGEQNQVLKRTMYEPSIHEPLIISGPDVHKGKQVRTPVSLIDLYPTLMDMARTDYAACADQPAFPDELDGESLMPQLSGNSERERDWAFAEYNGDRCCTGSYMLRKDRWKYIKHVGYTPQLFDIEDDPWETEDRADSEPGVVEDLDATLTENFDCEEIDARAREYDRRSFREWRNQARSEGHYEQTMAHVYSGYNQQSIEEMIRWRAEDEGQINDWLGE